MHLHFKDQSFIVLLTLNVAYLERNAFKRLKRLASADMYDEEERTIKKSSNFIDL